MEGDLAIHSKEVESLCAMASQLVAEKHFDSAAISRKSRELKAR